MQGPVGPAGAPATTPLSALAGHGLGVLGDSISSEPGNPWQTVVLARTGATLSFQDARSGRTFPYAFECYGTTTPGTALSTYRLLPNGNCSYPSQASTVGNTLAQNLATTDMLLLRLGTNDQNYTLGTLGDATNAETVYGNMRWVVETLLTAKPTLRLILITPELNGFAPVAAIQGVVQAEVAYGNSMGLPVLNLYAVSGNNVLTNPVYTRDWSPAQLGTHPSDWAYTNVDGPVIAQFILRYF